MKAVELMQKRRTVRKFAQNPVPREDLLRMVECARLAPSAANIQPLKYLVISSEQLCVKVFELTAWAGYLRGLGTPGEGERPTAYIAVLGDTEIKKTGFELDAGAAAMSIILAAEEQGIASCWIGSVNRKAAYPLLGLDEKYNIIALIALGYPAENPVLEDAADNIKYFKDENGVLHVPKRPLDEIIVDFK